MEGLGRGDFAGGMKTVHVNGRSMETLAGTIAELAAELSPAPQTLLIELNKQALLRSQWETTNVRDGDELEILRVSAGG